MQFSSEFTAFHFSFPTFSFHLVTGIKMSTTSSSPSSPPPPTTPTKIIDLDDDCLVKCFIPLDLPSLFAVSVANEWLRSSAGFVYKQKFGVKKVQIKRDPFPFWLFSHSANSITDDEKSAPHEINNCVEVCGLKTCLQFLRCMGSAIDNLTIGYLLFDDNEYDYIHEYINKYCAESLTNIVFQDKENHPIEYFDKPFVNVQTVAVYHSTFGNQFQLFPKWFPNMRTLELRDVKMLDHTMTMPFNHLRDLSINIVDGNCGLSKRMAARLFRFSRQLQHLKIRIFGDDGMALSALLDIIEANRNISKLNVSMENEMVVLSRHIERLVKEHPSLNELDLTGYLFNVNDALVVLQQLKSLEKFCFQLKNAQIYGDLVAQLEMVQNQWKPSIRSECLNHHRQIVTLER